MVWQLLDWWERTLSGHVRQEELSSLLTGVVLQQVWRQHRRASDASVQWKSASSWSSSFFIGGCVPGPFGALGGVQQGMPVNVPLPILREEDLW